MPTLQQKIAIWKTLLLDLSRRNRLINCTASKRGMLTIIQPSVLTLYDQLVHKESKLSFTRHVTQAVDARVYGMMELLRSTGASLTVTLGDIQSDQSVEEQALTLRSLRSKARLALDEQGQNLLYLAVGFVRWYDQHAQNAPMNSPLLLVPVMLVNSAPSEPYILQMAEEEIVVNPTLAYLFAERYHFEFPPFDADEDDLEAYFNTLRPLLSEKGWSLAEECRLGIFSFQKLNMYKDLLANEGRALENPVLQQMYAGGRRTAAELPEHDAIPPAEVCHIVSADSSQLDAIARSRLGESFVLQGPPGTGKSQTITNIIAQALADGKRVLFVSEKMAALQVVYSRLVRAGLGDFCLPLHDHKANKREILQMIGQTLEKRVVRSLPNAAAETDRLALLRGRLNRYPCQLHEVRNPLGASLYEVFGELSALQDVPAVTLPIADAASMTSAAMMEAEEQLVRLGSLEAGMTVPIHQNPWRGVRSDGITQGQRMQTGQLMAAAARQADRLMDVLCTGGMLLGRAMPEPGVLTNALESAQALLNLPVLPDSWRQAVPAQLHAQLTGQADMARTHAQVQAEALTHFSHLPDPAEVLRDYAELPDCCARLQALGIDPSRLDTAHVQLTELTQQLAQMLEDWRAALPQLWSEKQPLPGAVPLWQAIRTLDALPGYSLGWLNRTQRAEALAAARPLAALDASIREMNARLTETWLPAILDMSPQQLAEAAYILQSQRPGDAYPPVVARVMALRREPDFPRDVFLREPAFNLRAWVSGVDALLNGPFIISNVSLLPDAVRHMADLRARLGCLKEAADRLSVGFSLRTLQDFAIVRQAFGVIADIGRFPKSWLASRSRRDVRRALEALNKADADIRKRTAAILLGWDKRVLDLDARAMLNRFRTDYTSFLRRLRPDYRQDVRQLAGCRKRAGKPDDAECVCLLTDLVALQDARQAYDAQMAEHRHLFADRTGTLPSWAEAERMLDALSEESIADTLEVLSMNAPGCTLDDVSAIRRLLEDAKPDDLGMMLFNWLPGLADDFESAAPVAEMLHMLDAHTARLAQLSGLFAMLESALQPEVPCEDALIALRGLADAHEELIASCYQQLTALAEKQQAYDASAAHGAHRLQPLWNGRSTDWPTLMNALETLDAPDAAPLLERLARLMAAHPKDDWAGRFQLIALHDPRTLCDALTPILPELPRMSAAEASAALRRMLQSVADVDALLDRAVPMLRTPETGFAALQGLLALYRWAQLSQLADLNADQRRKLAGPHDKGRDTDWTTLADAAAVLAGMCTDAPGMPLGRLPWAMSLQGDRTALRTWTAEAASALAAWETASEALFVCFDDDAWRTLSFAAQHERLMLAARAPELLEQYQQYTACMRLMEQAGLHGAVEQLHLAGVAPMHFALAWRKAFLLSWISTQLPDAPDVEAFQAAAHGESIQRFQAQDDRCFEVAKVQLQHALTARLPHADADAPGEVAILTHEMNKKTRIMPIRKLFKRIPYLLQALKPCLMMSPLSVAYFLDSDFFQFDMVIFDEASQIFPQDAIGAILRGKQTIIAGDVKQMPPSNFFAAAADGPEEDWDDGEDEEVIGTPMGDSILEEAGFTLPQTSLLWHYRSRDESLIAFSNQHFYNNRLYTFPGNSLGLPDTGVEYIHVRDGVYHQRRNRREAERCVQLICEHIQRHPERSLGVVAFSEAQQAEIEDLLWQARERMPQFNDFFDEGRDEPFFIKNLENVQGDERDTIIFSICYARAEDGRMRLNFGPLGRSGGERRLNVAVTRARCNIKLIGSILPRDIDLNRAHSEGARLLRGYIEYAMAARAVLPDASRADDAPDAFADSIARFLTQQGYAVTRQVGRSAYRVDIAVHRRDGAGAYLAGILCDGPGYAAARTARDRDVIRRRMLTSLGWQLIDCWAPDWAAHPASARKALLERLEALAAEAPAALLPPMPVSAPIVCEYEAAPTENADPLELPDYPAAQPSYTHDTSLRRLDGARMTFEQGAMLQIIGAEQPIHMDVLYQRMAPHCGRTKVTSAVRQMVQAELAPMLGQEVQVQEDFCTLSSCREIPARKAGGREIEQISLPELMQVMRTLLRSSYGLSRSEAISEAARLLGFARTGPRILARLESALQILLRDGHITIVRDKIQWKE